MAPAPTAYPALALLGLWLAACALPPVDAIPPRYDCMTDPPCLDYLHTVRDQIFAHWVDSAGSNEVPAGSVRVIIRLSSSGEVTASRVFRASSLTLRETCTRALREAGPFAPPPPRLAGREIRLVFTLGEEP